MLQCRGRPSAGRRRVLGGAEKPPGRQIDRAGLGERRADVHAQQNLAGHEPKRTPQRALQRATECGRTRRAGRAGGGRPAAIAELTPREREVLVQMAYGASNKEIAARFVVSEATVRTHVGRVLFRTGSRDRVQAVLLAFRTGLVQPADLLRDANT